MVFNLRQRQFLIIGTIIFVVIGVFPPWVNTYRSGSTRGDTSAGYNPIFDPPPTLNHSDYPMADRHAAFGVSIDLSRLMIQWSLLVTSCAIGIFMASDAIKTNSISASSVVSVLPESRTSVTFRSNRADPLQDVHRWDLVSAEKRGNLKDANKTVNMAKMVLTFLIMLMCIFIAVCATGITKFFRYQTKVEAFSIFETEYQAEHPELQPFWPDMHKTILEHVADVEGRIPAEIRDDPNLWRDRFNHIADSIAFPRKGLPTMVGATIHPHSTTYEDVPLRPSLPPLPTPDQLPDLPAVK